MAVIDTLRRIASILSDIVTARGEAGPYGHGTSALSTFAHSIQSVGGVNGTPDDAAIRSLVAYAMAVSIGGLDYRLTPHPAFHVRPRLVNGVNTYGVSPVVQFNDVSRACINGMVASFVPPHLKIVTEIIVRATLQVPEICTLGDPGVIFITNGFDVADTEVMDFRQVRVRLRFFFTNDLYTIEYANPAEAALPVGAVGSRAGFHTVRQLPIAPDRPVLFHTRAGMQRMALEAGFWHDLTGAVLSLEHFIGVIRVELDVAPAIWDGLSGTFGNVEVRNGSMLCNPFQFLDGIGFDEHLNPVLVAFLASFRGDVIWITDLYRVYPAPLWNVLALVFLISSRLLVQRPVVGHFY